MSKKKPLPKHSGSKYHKRLLSIGGEVVFTDVYRVLDAFGVACPACQHAVKKLLMPGLRGKNTAIKDLEEARDAVTEAIKMVELKEEKPHG